MIRIVIVLFCLILPIHSQGDPKNATEINYEELIGGRSYSLPFLYVLPEADWKEIRHNNMLHIIVDPKNSPWKMEIKFSNKFKLLIDSRNSHGFIQFITTSEGFDVPAGWTRVAFDTPFDIRMTFEFGKMQFYLYRKLLVGSNWEHSLEEIDRITIDAPSGLRLFHFGQLPQYLLRSYEPYNIIFPAGSRMDISIYNDGGDLKMNFFAENRLDIQFHANFNFIEYKVDLDSYFDNKYVKNEQLPIPKYLYRRVIDITIINTDAELILLMDQKKLGTFKHRTKSDFEDNSDSYQFLKIDQDDLKLFRLSVNKLVGW